ncbi:MAG TPA: Arc family DNA-binding protein [Stenotrophomonas sp.]|nr:Arc family DNA-binding protein [Stenotrophomonas sp.]
MARTETTKRSGRPPKQADQKPETFSVRLLPAIRATLQTAADEAGRSLASEIATRLQRSLEQENPAQAKRDLALQELREAASEVVRLWDVDDRNEFEEAELKDAIDDLETWLRQLEKAERDEAFGIIKRAAEANRSK